MYILLCTCICFRCEFVSPRVTLVWCFYACLYLCVCARVLPGFLWRVCSHPGGATASFPRPVCRASMPCPNKTSTLSSTNHSQHPPPQQQKNITATTSVFLEASQLDTLDLSLLVPTVSSTGHLVAVWQLQCSHIGNLVWIMSNSIKATKVVTDAKKETYF